MKEKSVNSLILKILVVLLLISFGLGFRLNYPPQEKELNILIYSRLTNPQSRQDKEIQSTILNNIFFGKMKTVNPRAQEKINQSIIQLLIEEDFLETILEIGMQFEVGSKGDKLSGGQRQKLAIARAFLKQPRVLIMDEATSALDNKSQARIQNLLSNKWKGNSTLIAVVHRLDIIKEYDRVAVMKAGKIEEIGTYDELISKKGMLYELEYGKQ